MNANGSVSTSQPTQAERDAAARLLPMIWGIHISRSVYLAAKLGIADLLGVGPASSGELSLATGTHEPSLYRVLRLLAAVGVLEERPDRAFSLTSLGDRLRSDAPAGMRSWAMLVDSVSAFGAFEHIVDTVTTGRPGLERALGSDLFSYLEKHPQNAAAFDAAMSERTTMFAPSVASTYDFTDVKTVVDVGGGKGTLLVEILRQHSHLLGTLLELPHVAARADAVLDAVDVGDRCEVLVGDFFEAVPAGADRYIVANVLHDWDDVTSARILANCRQAMSGNGRMLIVERLIADDPGLALPTLLSDINMLVLSGGRERTNAEYSDLLAAAGFRMSAVFPVAFPYGVIEGVPA